MSVTSADEVSNQVQYGQLPDDWTVFCPPKSPLVVQIFYGLCYVVLWPLICTAGFALLFWFWLQPELVQSSPWPMYTTYPILAVIAVASPFFLIWLVWWLEKRDRDILLVLRPSGFIQYKPWSNERKRRAKVIEYANVEAIMCQKKMAGIVVNISDKDGKWEKVFITWKYGGTSPSATVHQEIAQRIINNQRSLSECTMPEGNDKPGDQLPSNDGWLQEGKVSRRVLLRISGGLAIAAPLVSLGLAVAELVHWDSRTLFTNKGHTSLVKFVAWSPDGKRISSAGWDHIAHIWDGNAGSSPLVTYRQHSNGVNSAAWSPDGKLLVSDGDNGILQIWEASTGKIRLTYTAQQADGNEVSSAVWSPDGTSIVSGDSLGIVQVWSTSTGKTRLNYTAHTDGINTVAWSLEGSRIASASYDATAKIWDASTGKLLSVHTEPKALVNDLAWSPDSTRIALACTNKLVHVWEVSTGRILRTYTGHTGPILKVAWSPDGKHIASASSDATVQVWEAATGNQSFSPYRGHSFDVWSVAWSPDGTRIISGSMDTTVQVWHATNGFSFGFSF